MKHVLALFVAVLLAVYMLVLTYIPLLEWLYSPSFILGAWLVGAGAVWTVAVWLVYRFSWIKLGVWWVLVTEVHAAIFMVGAVKALFDIDACLNRSGSWQDGKCRV